MTPELWQRLKPLYHAVLEMPDEARAQFVAEACREDTELKEELTALLKTNGEQTGSDDLPLINFRDLFPEGAKSFSVGQLILDRFRIVRFVGGGGMGEVYEAIDLEMGRIALKTIRPDIASNPDMFSRFKKEVHLALKISGPHVCRIHAFYVLPDLCSGSKRAFLTMEFLNGITLADKISESGPLPWREAKAVALEICVGLQTIHEAGIIHRDLKSRNVMLTDRNGAMRAVVMDFGLAHQVFSPTSETATDFTTPGVIVGTPNYMAPEQFEGKEVTPATDLYALGVVLYELVTGKHPFEANSPVGAAILRGRRPCLASSLQRGIPRCCDEIICRCLEFDPKLRYQSAGEVAEDLRGGLFSPARLRKNWFRVFAGIACLTLSVYGLLLIPAIGERVRGMLFSSREKHIAVLPLEFVGNNPETQALGDGLMDSLAGKLSNLDAKNQSLWVVPASEVRKRKVNDPSSALREFGATIVVTGSFERNSQVARLKLTLIDPKKMREIGFVDVDNQAADLAGLQDEAVTRLGRLMNISVSDDLLRDRGGPVVRAAYEEYLTALGYMQRYDKPGNLDLAITALHKSLAADDRFALGLAQLGEAYRLKYQLDKDPKWLEQALGYCKQAIELDGRISSAYVTLARIHELTGKHELAVHEFQRALDSDPRDAEALNGLAHSYQNAGRNVEAEAMYVKAVAVRPGDWSGYNSLGNFYDDNGRHREAIAQYRYAIGLTPDNSVLFANLGAAYVNSSDPKMLDEAERALRKSIAISPNYVAYANLGNLYGMQHRFAESAAVSERALQLDDQDYDVWNNLAEAYEELGNRQKAYNSRRRAIELVERAVELNPQDAEAEALLGALLAKDGIKDKALTCIQTSLALSPNSEYVLSEVADTYESLGERSLAIKYLRKALQHGFPSEQLNGDPNLREVIEDPQFRDAGK
jgi:serine/threonine protein kinase/tetratricopeptide (TPR) repeat protein